MTPKTSLTMAALLAVYADPRLSNRSRIPRNKLKRLEECKPATPVQSSKNLVGRNEPCPCLSGKKYKHCCKRT